MKADEDANTGRGHRRAFLATAGAALAAGATSTRAGISHFGGDVVSSDQYFVGLVDNAALPGVAGELMLNV